MKLQWLLSVAVVALVNPPLLAAHDPETAPSVPSPRLDQGSNLHLIAWWKFDKVVEGALIDSSGQNHHASTPEGSNAETMLVQGRIGQGLQLDGSTSLVVTGFRGVKGTAPRTVAAWIKTKSPSGTVVSWGADEPGQIWNLGFIRRHLGVSPKGGYLYMNEATDDGEWHHVAVVVNDASPPNLHDDVTLYKDGEPAVIHDIGLLDLWPINTGQDLDVTIGAGFKGTMDDLRIYSRALSEDEIHDLFQLAGKD